MTHQIGFPPAACPLSLLPTLASLPIYLNKLQLLTETAQHNRPSRVTPHHGHLHPQLGSVHHRQISEQHLGNLTVHL